MGVDLSGHRGGECEPSACLGPILGLFAHQVQVFVSQPSGALFCPDISEGCQKEEDAGSSPVRTTTQSPVSAILLVAVE